MRIERHIIQEFYNLADDMLRPYGKRGSRYYAGLTPEVQLLRVARGTLLSVHSGYLALQRIVSRERIPTSVRCCYSWLAACSSVADSPRGPVDTRGLKGTGDPGNAGDCGPTGSILAADSQSKTDSGYVEVAIGNSKSIRNSKSDSDDHGGTVAEFRWRSQGEFQTLRLDVRQPVTVGAIPTLHRIEGDLVRALGWCCQVVDHQETRFCRACIQLDRRSGSVIGTDGKQLLQLAPFSFAGQDSFAGRESFAGHESFAVQESFAGQDDAVLVPANGIFLSPLLQRFKSVRCGITRGTIVMQIGPWTLRLPLQVNGRYPDTQSMLQRLTTPLGRVRLSVDDMTDLRGWIETLTGDPCERRADWGRADWGLANPEQVSPDQADCKPIVLVVRFGPALEISVAPSTCQSLIRTHHGLQSGMRLRRSSHWGNPAEYTVQAKYLLTTARLNLRELLHFGQNSPLVARSLPARQAARPAAMQNQYIYQTMRVDRPAGAACMS